MTPFYKDCPCKRECPRRNDACHGTCKDYAEWSAKHEADEAAKRKKKLDGSDADAVLINTNRRIEKIIGRVKKIRHVGRND